jgi:hypothetical protein
MGLINDFELWCLLEIEIHSRFVLGSHHSHYTDHLCAQRGMSIENWS